MDFKNFISPETKKKLSLKKNSLKSEDNEEFKIINGIPRFVDSMNYASAFGLQWNTFNKTQLDSHTGTSITEDRLVEAIGGPLESIKGKKFLEAGSGAGRFTEILLKYEAIVYSFDISEAVEANKQNNCHKNLTIFQCSITQIPFDDNFFDAAICLGVLQHTQNSKASLKELSRVVKSNGLISFDHYKRHLGHYFSMYLIYWFVIKNIPKKNQLRLTNRLTRIFFPIHWYFRKNTSAQFLLRRISPISFYYGMFPLTKKQHFEFSMLDTHDKNTDHFKRHLSEKGFKMLISSIGFTNCKVKNGGTGLLGIVKNC